MAQRNKELGVGKKGEKDTDMISAQPGLSL